MGNKSDIDCFQNIICIFLNIYINFDPSQKYYREVD